MSSNELKDRINYALFDRHSGPGATRVPEWNVVTLTQIVQIDLADFVPAVQSERFRILTDAADFVVCETAHDALKAFEKGRLYLCEGDH